MEINMASTGDSQRIHPPWFSLWQNRTARVLIQVLYWSTILRRSRNSDGRSRISDRPKPNSRSPKLKSGSQFRRTTTMSLAFPLGRTTPSGDLAYKIDFFLRVWGAIVAKNILMPDGRLAVGIGVLPRIERQVGLGFPGDQAPTKRRHVVFFGDWQDALEGTVAVSRHELSAKHGAVILLQPLNALFEIRGLVVVVERNDVGLLQLDFFDAAQLIWAGPIALPQAAGERLTGRGGAREFEQ